MLLQESIKKGFDEVNNKVMADSKKVYTYYYKDKQSGLMVKNGIESTEIKIVDRDLKGLNNLEEKGVTGINISKSQKK